MHTVCKVGFLHESLIHLQLVAVAKLNYASSKKLYFSFWLSAPILQTTISIKLFLFLIQGWCGWLYRGAATPKRKRVKP